MESRVRFLSFLGIGRQVEHCGFIVHTANDVYIAHVLCCQPSSGAICKTIEAACKVSNRFVTFWARALTPSFLCPALGTSCGTKSVSTLTAPSGEGSPPRLPAPRRPADAAWRRLAPR